MWNHFSTLKALFLHMISQPFVRPVKCEAAKQGLAVFSICERFLFVSFNMSLNASVEQTVLTQLLCVILLLLCHINPLVNYTKVF